MEMSDREIAEALCITVALAKSSREKQGLKNKDILMKEKKERARAAILEFGTSKTVKQLAEIADCPNYLICMLRKEMNISRIAHVNSEIRKAILNLPQEFSAQKILDYLVVNGVKTSTTAVRDYRAKMVKAGEVISKREREKPLIVTYNSSSWNPSHDMLTFSDKAQKAMAAARFF